MKKARLLVFFLKKNEALLIHTGAGDAEGAWRLGTGMFAVPREELMQQGYSCVAAVVAEIERIEVEKYRREITKHERAQRQEGRLEVKRPAAKNKNPGAVGHKSDHQSVQKSET